MKQSRFSIFIIAVLLLCAASSVFAQKNVFSDVPKSHWAYAALSRLTKAKLVGQMPVCTAYGRRSLILTRYEFAVLIQRLQLQVKPPAKLTEEQRKLLPTIQRMAREFAPEMKQLGH